ncbi:6488_t:CDS:2 [Paraglomus occultum]|uniref:6488_t:CDS:1 n=1 Tax=Paraglomus occultum TaxID=144539 RepID=A0A9N8YX86_9GLOM|nr:6488_t:CDS:2 [Paraglomus occultum]
MNIETFRHTLTPYFLKTAIILSGLLSFASLGAKQVAPLPLVSLPVILLAVRYSKKIYYDVAIFSFVAIGIAASYKVYADEATSNPLDDNAALFIIGSIISLMTICPIYIDKSLRQRKKIGYFLFPALWTLVWGLYRYFSPLGSWGDWAYSLQGPFMQSAAWFGLSGIDFIMAWMAQVIAEFVYDAPDKFLGAINEEETTYLLVRNDRFYQKKHRKFAIGSTLFFLIVYVLGASRMSTIESNDPGMKSFGVACILGSTNYKTSPTEQMLAATRHYVSRAKIVLWSESALHIESTEELASILKDVMEIAYQSHSYIGLSYTIPTANGMRKNVLNLISPQNVSVFEYVKSHPVPFAESHSVMAGPGILPLASINITHGHSNVIGNIKVSGAICFDMDFPNLIWQASDAKLMLSPAQTWSAAIGMQHFKMAAARAIENGFWILRCDAGGVSGVVDDYGRFRLWVPAPKNGVTGFTFEFPLLEEKIQTWYAFWGDAPLLALVIGILASIVGPIWVVQMLDEKAEQVKTFVNGEIRKHVNKFVGEEGEGGGQGSDVTFNSLEIP